MTKNRNTKIYNFLCFKVITAATTQRAVFPYDDSFESLCAKKVCCYCNFANDVFTSNEAKIVR